VHVSLLVWTITLTVMGAILAADLLIIGRRPHIPSMRESSLWVAFYVTLAVAFGMVILSAYGPRYGGEFFAGWVTEYSLSVDNLFVFVVIMARFRTPREYQQKALMIGIVLALVMRGGFIAVGAAALNRFEWIFYIFGFFLVYTAVNLARHGEGEPADFKESPVVRYARQIVPLTHGYRQAKISVREGGRRMFTPMLIVMIALGTTDLIFALDSIPAIFGLTKEAYLVFTANVFALMGLRQLYFLLGNLLDRLVYLSFGLAGVLGFIGVKLVLEALHANEVPFVNRGDPVEWAPRIPIWLSLTIIIGMLAVAAVASLIKSGRDQARAAAAAAGLNPVTGPATTAPPPGPVAPPGVPPVGRPPLRPSLAGGAQPGVPPAPVPAAAPKPAGTAVPPGALADRRRAADRAVSAEPAEGSTPKRPD
jgi:tellurite resistance protein TerC